FDSGRTATEILAFLEGRATRGVPQPLAYLVNDMGRRFGNVRVGAVTTYVRSDDPALLAQVLQARATAKLRLRSIAPTVLVTDVDAATVTATLQASGYLPAREAPGGGLLVSRPAAHRLAPSRFPGPKPAPAPDLPGLVAALRRVPVTAEPRPPAPASLAPPQPSLLDIPRPSAIVKGTREIALLLDQACEEFWLLRLSYVGSNGRGTELTVEPTEIDGRRLWANCFPRGNEREFVIDRIEWVRVLTEAEEGWLG
ncbi:MAG: helicase-associated domain-containing protein, partial [Acidimicrobiales bacterium]|nr:helicase-associated domain-containing protein [Acidimicrobiales bacterium]